MHFKTIGQVIVFLLTVCLLIPSVDGYTVWDGFQESDAVAEDVDLLGLNSASSIMGAGASHSTRHARLGYKYSALWRHGSSKVITYYGIPADLSAYDLLEMWIYAEDIPGSEAEMLARIVTAPAAPGTSSYLAKRVFVKNGWNHILIPISQMSRTRSPSLLACQYFQLTVNGWDIVAVPEAKFYIATAKLSISDGIEASYTESALEGAQQVMDIATVIGAGSTNVLKNGAKDQLSAECREIGGVLYAPEEFFTTHMGISVTSTDASLTVKAGNKQETVNIQEEPAYAVQIINGVRYFPAEKICELAGFCTYFGSKCLVVGGEKILDYLVVNDTMNEVMEIVAYKAMAKALDSKKITEEVWDELRRRWVYNVVGDDSFDPKGQEFAAKVASIDALADAALSKLQKGDNVIELFQAKPMTTTEQLSAAYRQIRDIAVAWGTYGSKYYQDEKVLEDIIYAMEWMYQNRYGRAEISGTGWRSVGDPNWWDWQIGSPRRILDVMMIVYEHLNSTQIKNWLALFHYVVPRVTSSGSNMLNLGKELIGAAILEKDAKALVSARDAVNASFVNCDKGNNGGSGYYTDGSYFFHIHHALNGLYGLEQIQYTGPLLSLLAGTEFEYTAPQIHNVVGWVLDGQVPFNVNGSYMRAVLGRYPGHSKLMCVRFLSSMIGLLDFVEGETKEEFRSLIKYYVTTDSKTNYFTELTLPEGIELKKILDDKTVPERGEYHLSKTFTAIDRTVHHRDDWAFGLSMNSERIAGYESINGEDGTGWYHGDGGYQIFVGADQYQYSIPYWASVNPYRIPGATADTQERYAESVALGADYMSSQDFVGGVSLDETYSMAAMQLESYHNETGRDTPDTTTQNLSSGLKHTCTLMAKKSWFMFDDEVVALGSDINAGDGFSVETTVDNRIAHEMVSTQTQSERYEIVSVTADQVPQPENIPENTLDGELATYWAGENDASITWDIGEVKPCGFLALGLRNGNTRKAIFQLYVSEDGQNWTEVFNGSSSGTTAGLEMYDLKGMQARYIRFFGHGNTSNEWNSVTEAAVYSPNRDGSAEFTIPKFVGAEPIYSSRQNTEIGEEPVSLSDERWLNYDNHLGYWFPTGNQELWARRTAEDSSFFELWLDHGVNPQKATYEYVILPGMTKEQTEEYSKNPQIEVLANTEKVQAVRHTALGITGIVFWERGSFAGIQVTEPMLVMVRESDSGATISVSDPTQKLSNARITVEGHYTGVVVPYQVKVSASDNKTTLEVNFTDSLGRTIETKLSK